MFQVMIGPCKLASLISTSLIWNSKNAWLTHFKSLLELGFIDLPVWHNQNKVRVIFICSSAFFHWFSSQKQEWDLSVCTIKVMVNAKFCKYISDWNCDYFNIIEWKSICYFFVCLRNSTKHNSAKPITYVDCY